ncbi:MAG TPA: CRTAC1 family protein, partial [Chthonomonadales bacterium]|nr:CRTAC1 family protein [Chthonomonadales bacterium]
PNHLFRNTLGDPNRKGKPIFEDVTVSSGTQGAPDAHSTLQWKWSTSAAWLDYDRDGKLDLFVCNYLRWTPKTDIRCVVNGVKDYCPPQVYPGTYCTLYHNEGNGHFKDVSVQMGIRAPGLSGRSLGVAVADFNGDGWPDIAVSNDTWPNFLFINDHGRRFIEQGQSSGMAFGNSTRARAGMGIDASDWHNGGQFGLLIGNFWGEGLALFDNAGAASFTEVTRRAGMRESSVPVLSFGLFFFDYDLDGKQDALVADGHVVTRSAMYGQGDNHERPLLFHNLGGERFAEVGISSGFTNLIVGRGAAYADIDNDGDLDVGLFANASRFLLYRNDGGNRNHWIRFRTVGTRSNRDGIGAVIRIQSAGVTQMQQVHSGGSYLSECQREPTFGLGSAPGIGSATISWPSGAVTRTGPLAAGAQYLATEGRGVTVDPRWQKIAAQERHNPFD